MIIGNGLIANKCKDIKYNYSNYLIFASGVSNSSETNVDFFEKEFQLLQQNVKSTNKIIIYFSSCALCYEKILQVPYYRHKLIIENYLKRHNHIIIRLPQVISNSENENTIIGNFYKKIKNNERITIQNRSKRYFIDIDDVIIILEKILLQNYKNKIINLANPFKYTPHEVIMYLKDVLNIHKFNNITFEDFGYEYDIDLFEQNLLTNDLNILFGKNYLYERLIKYYGKK